MSRRWFSIRAIAAVLLILSLSLVMIHWHQEGAGQDCGLCATHQMAGLEGTAQVAPAAPQRIEWRYHTESASSESSAFIPAHPGRAPPASSSI
jgi:hypothetical protein